MKIQPYRESLLSLLDQVFADFELQVLFYPNSTTSPYYKMDLKYFAEQVFNAINSPQVLTASSIGGTPIPGLTNLDTLPGGNQFNGDKLAPNLKPRAAVPFHATPHQQKNQKLPEHDSSFHEFTLPDGETTNKLTRKQLLVLLKTTVADAEMKK